MVSLKSKYYLVRTKLYLVKTTNDCPKCTTVFAINSVLLDILFRDENNILSRENDLLFRENDKSFR